MINIYCKDPNAIRRRFKTLKYIIKFQQRIKLDIERIQEKVDLIKWTDETYEQRIHLYKQLGERWEMYRMDSIRIQWLKEELLQNANLTA